MGCRKTAAHSYLLYLKGADILFENPKQTILTCCFLGLEVILYALLLFTGGKLEIYSSYLSILLCFLFALLWGGKHKRLMVGGLACTLGADFFLVICSPRQQLWGMVFFLAAQTLYAIHLHMSGSKKCLLWCRIGLIILVEAVAILILKDNLDLLAVISVCYYVNLIMNMVAAFLQFRKNPLLAIGFVFFIMCDTVIGLQVASEGYLPIGEDSLLHRILFVDFNIAWVFYLPSQVLISLSSHEK